MPTGPLGSSPDLYPQDQYQPNDWNFVFKMPENPGAGSKPATNSGLYAIGNVTKTNYYGATTVVHSYTTANGTIIMSNVNGDPVTNPQTGNNGFYFREGQAVQFDPGNGVNPVATGTWAVNATSGSTEGSIVFSIVDNGLLGNSFALLWAMTCATTSSRVRWFLQVPRSFRLLRFRLPFRFSPLASARWVCWGGGGNGRPQRSPPDRNS